MRPEERPEPSPPLREDGETWDEEFNEEGKLVLASDGACPNQQGDSRARRSGQGLFYGEGHACNYSWPTDTYSQGAQRAEVRAATRWIAWAWSPTELWTDSSLVVKGMRNILNERRHGMKGHKDLWQRIEIGVNAKGHNNFAVKKVKGHMKKEECHGDEQLLEEKKRNDKADELAVKAAEEAKVAKKVLAVSKQERRLIRDIQRMMVDIALERYEALKSMKTEEIEANLDAAEQRKSEANNRPVGEDALEEEEGFLEPEAEEDEDLWGGIDINGNGIERHRPAQQNQSRNEKMQELEKKAAE